MADKNITFRQKNTSGVYDKLYTKTTATQSKLSTETAALFGDGTSDADAALAKIADTVKSIGNVQVKVVDPSGNPVQGAIIQGLTGTPVTAEDGTAHGIIKSNPITVVSSYIDLANKTVDVTDYIGLFATCEITLSAVTNKTIEIFTSKAIKFSTATSAVDVCLVGGGGSGAPSVSAATWHSTAGGGGGGGDVVNYYNIPITPNKSYQVIVGAGGEYPVTGYVVGSAGGDSKFDTYKASGGNGASERTGGSGGGGAGGDVGNAGISNTTKSLFDDGVTFYSGGGAGGQTGTSDVAKGGSPNGADGASAYYGKDATTAGIGGGGGGGSAYTDSYAIKSGSSGGNGLVVIRLK